MRYPQLLKFSGLKWFVLLSALIAFDVFVFANEAVSGSDSLQIEAGKKIYQQGILTSGEALKGQAMGEITLTGQQAACINCHLRSGLGTSEAGQQALPINGAALYQPGPPSFWYQHQITQPGVNRFRPAYTDNSLAKAIVGGVTPTDRTLDPAMPRFNLGKDNLNALTAYLKSLSDNSPGVDDSTLHWATIVTPDTTAEQRKALLDVMNAYISQRNAETERYQHNGHIPPNRGYAPLRKWELHVWDLHGAPETWSAQFEDNFKQRPVFAVLSGIGSGDWHPIHAFCESREIACLFPNTNLPAIQDNTFFSIYFSKGLVLEAQSLAVFLRSNSKDQKTPFIQVYRDTAEGKGAATELRKHLQADSDKLMKDFVIAADKKIDAAFWRKLLKTENPGTLVLWLYQQDIDSFKSTGDVPHAVYLSGHLLKGQLPKSLSSASHEVFLVSPWGEPAMTEQRFAQVQAWMNDKGVAVSDELIQSNTLWLMQLVDNAVEQITHHFSPAYLIERIEDMMGNLANSSLYPRVSLGPGQRFAAKGCYILKLSDNGQFKPVGDVIIPP